MDLADDVVVLPEVSVPGSHLVLRVAAPRNAGDKKRLGWGDEGSGGVLWDAAHILNALLVAHPTLVANKRVMELGAGQGLPGLLAHHLGAAHVTLTDFVPQLVETLADSARVAMAQSSRDGGGGGDAEGERGRRVVSAAMLDWQAEARDVEAGVAVTEEDTFEVLLASDVVYAVEHAELVATVTARRLATTHTARAVNVMGIRGTMWQMMEHGSPVYLVEALQAALRVRGLGVCMLPMPVLTEERQGTGSCSVPTTSAESLARFAGLLSATDIAEAAAAAAEDSVPADEESVVVFVCWWPQPSL